MWCSGISNYIVALVITLFSVILLLRKNIRNLSPPILIVFEDMNMKKVHAKTAPYPMVGNNFLKNNFFQHKKEVMSVCIPFYK